MTVIEFALLGLGIGAVYALLGNGLVLIYRGSGVLNFAHGAYAMVGAYTFWELHDKHDWAYGEAFALAVLGVGVLGALTHLLVMRRLRQASPLARLIATLGVLTLLEGLATIRYKGALVQVPTSLPHRPLHFRSLVVPEDRLIMLGIALVLALGLTYLSRRTTIGVAMSAVAENRRAAAALGWSPDAIATLSWSLGTALAATAGILIVPLSGLNASQLTLVVIAAMAAALAAGFSSFTATLAVGVGIGIVQSLMAEYVTVTGLSDAVPFLIIMVVLVLRGRSLPVRSDILERLPRAGTGVLRPRVAIPVVAAVALGMSTVFSSALTVAITTQVIVAIILLSVLTVTGYAGQLSLAQYGLAGMGGYIAGRLVSSEHWPFVAALVVGIIGAAAVGVVFGIPALRTRGVNLAVVTLGLGFALEVMIFNNSSLTGSLNGTRVGAASLFGLDIDPIRHPGRYGVFCLACLMAAIVVVANVRRGRAGRSFIAVRANERAAASLGVDVLRAKLFAFMTASAIAGLGGVLLAFQSFVVVYGNYDIFASINAIAFSTVGGIGFLAGPLIGSTLASGGIVSWMLNRFGSLDRWLPAVGGLAVLVMLLQNPDGLAGSLAEQVRARYNRRRSELQARAAPLSDEVPVVVVRSVPRALTVDHLTVRYGGVTAVNDLSLDVQPGEIVGLIGPNGAGKTTVIDAVTGFTRPSAGRVVLGEVALAGLSAARRAALGLARSFQSGELFDDLTVRENLQTASDDRDARAYLTNLVWPGRSSLGGAAQAAIREFGLDAHLDARPSQLSHGVRRLVGIARAVARQPSLLLLDEPAAGLDSLESAELSTLIQGLAADWGMGILLVEHDMSVVMKICHRVAVIEFGTKIAEGTPAQIREDPLVIAAYLGAPSGTATPSAVGGGPAVRGGTSEPD